MNDIDVTEAEADSVVNELVEVLDVELYDDADQEVIDKLDIILTEIKAQNKSATAKLKVSLPIIPLVANYELDLDTESVLTEIWRKVRGLLKKEAVTVNPRLPR